MTDVVAPVRAGLVQLPGGGWVDREALARPCSCGGTWKWVAEKCVRCCACLPPRRDEQIFGWVDCAARRVHRKPPDHLPERFRP